MGEAGRAVARCLEAVIDMVDREYHRGAQAHQAWFQVDRYPQGRVPLAPAQCPICLFHRQLVGVHQAPALGPLPRVGTADNLIAKDNDSADRQLAGGCDSGGPAGGNLLFHEISESYEKRRSAAARTSQAIIPGHRGRPPLTQEETQPRVTDAVADDDKDDKYLLPGEGHQERGGEPERQYGPWTSRPPAMSVLYR